MTTANPFETESTTATAPIPANAPVATLASAQAELAAMRRIVTTLDALDPDTRHRVILWLGGRYPLADGESA